MKKMGLQTNILVHQFMPSFQTCKIITKQIQQSVNSSQQHDTHSTSSTILTHVQPFTYFKILHFEFTVNIPSQPFELHRKNQMHHSIWFVYYDFSFPFLLVWHKLNTGQLCYSEEPQRWRTAMQFGSPIKTQTLYEDNHTSNIRKSK